MEYNRKLNCLILIPLLFAAVFLSCAKSGSKMYYRMHLLWTRNFYINQIADLNNDSNDEILISHPGDQSCQIDVMDWELKTFYKSFRIDFDWKYWVGAFPAENFDSVNFLVSYRRNNKIFYKLLPPTPLTVGKSVHRSFLKNIVSFTQQKEIKTDKIPAKGMKDFITYTKAKDTKESDFHQSMGFLSFFNTPEGKKLALFSVNTGWDKNGKRGVIAYDVKRGRVAWKFYFGSTLVQSKVINFDKKNGDEIVISTYASNNGLSLNGTGDDSSYVFVLNSAGNLLWKRNIGPYWTRVNFETGYFDSYKKPELVVYLGLNRDVKPEHDVIYLIDPLTGKILRKSKKAMLSSGCSHYERSARGDFTGDGIDEIVAGTRDGYIKMIDGFFNIIKQSKGYNRIIDVIAVEDFDNDGRPEIAAFIRDEKIVIYDNNLNELCEYYIDSKCSFEILHANKKVYLLVKTTEGNKPVNRLFEVQRSVFPFPTAQAKGNPYLWTLPLLALAVAAFAVYGNRRKKMFDFITRFNSQLGTGNYTMIIDDKRKIRFIGTEWAKVLKIDPYAAEGKSIDKLHVNPLLTSVTEAVIEMIDTKKSKKTVSVKDEPEGSRTEYEIIANYLREFKLYAFAIIDKSEEEYIKKVRYWAVIAQDLAHGIKTVLASIYTDVQNQNDIFKDRYNREDKDMYRYYNSINKQIDRLLRMSNGFMRFVNFKKSELKPVDINKKVTELVLNLHSSCSSFIKIEWELDKSEPVALIDENQFETAFTNVFVNAVESISTEGVIRISTKKVHIFDRTGYKNYKDGYIEVTIQDNGCGIESVYLDKITQPYFTRKISGTGLGLALVKRIIESHEGDMQIHSQPGMGTSVSMRFRSYINNK